MDFVLSVILGSMGFGQKGWFVIGLNQHGFFLFMVSRHAKAHTPLLCVEQYKKQKEKFLCQWSLFPSGNPYGTTSYFFGPK